METDNNVQIVLEKRVGWLKQENIMKKRDKFIVSFKLLLLVYLFVRSADHFVDRS